MELKGLLYEKLLIILTRNIEAKIYVSENIDEKYESMNDLVRILGIFLDNAIEETEKREDGKIILEIMRTELGIGFCIANNYAEEPKLSALEEKGYSTKGEGRGNGLYWAKQVIEQHEDMYHNTEIRDGMLVQELEIVL